MDSPELIEEFKNASQKVADHYEKLEFSKAQKEIMLLADKANQYVDSKQPWVLIKDKGNEELVQSICTTSLNLFRILTIMLQPVIPGFVDKSLRFLKEDKIEWNSINKTLLNCKIDNFEAIVTRIDDNHLDKLMGN